MNSEFQATQPGLLIVMNVI